MTIEERAFSFHCENEWLYGIASLARQPSRRGVLIVVGGPQYRVGSHRQFALLARSLADDGIPACRFDYRGMGDSSGAARTFEHVERDLRAAIDAFIGLVPGLEEVVIWGLCDGASAALFYAAQDSRVCGLVLLNPWVRTGDGLAKATLKHYYLERLLQPALWRKIASGQFAWRTAARSFLQIARTAVGPATAGAAGAPLAEAAPPPLPLRMLGAFEAFQGKVLLVLSGADLTAKEFSDLAQSSRAWRKLLGSPAVSQQAIAEADHTFSRRVWRDQVARWTGDWVKSW
ncbi:MAG TPA: hydrolase 1, exosortase A system-associated [Telluria sp.]|nr:hydrolase 1, exosortase A system-associated [Telluria sp.]